MCVFRLSTVRKSKGRAVLSVLEVRTCILVYGAVYRIRNRGFANNISYYDVAWGRDRVNVCVLSLCVLVAKCTECKFCDYE